VVRGGAPFEDLGMIGTHHVPASHHFTHYVLRTTDAFAAREFYDAVLGPGRAAIVPLHERALARGARPHWLGQIEVHDVAAAVAAFEAKGAESLGPVGTFPEGRSFAVLRDPGGAIVGLTSPSESKGASFVVWHHLNSNDRSRVEQVYTSLFGWQLTQRVEVPKEGELHHFTWAGATGDVGSIGDIQGKSGRHPHWLFHFAVPDFTRAVATVRTLRGVVLGPFTLASGERLAVCDDPQGAAFALRG